MSKFNQTKGKQPPLETIEVEDADARLERIQRVLEQLNTTSPAAAADTAGRGMERIFNTAGPPDNVPRSEGSLNELLGRVQAFLPEIEASNTALAEKASLDPRSVDIENVDGDEKVIQMNLGLGVFEDRTGREGEGESDESSDEDEDGMEEDSDESSSDTDDSASSAAESDDPGAPNLGRTSAPLPKRVLLARPSKPLPKRGGRPEIIVLSEKTTDEAGG
ncbi:hypothetical protein C8R47DRAFT_1151025 [Mycena vitilis]|nr:hypothetical protein C8R47DRAFT_1151025 [Mycena vitilis]